MDSILRHRDLILQLTRREIAMRYRGSFMGFVWSFLNPLLMLAVYTFVFSTVFKTRWNVAGSQSLTNFALILFSGLILHGVVAEMLTRSPTLILSNTNYVTKVVFPLHILPIVAVNSAVFNALMSLVILVSAIVCFGGTLHWTIFYLPLILLPLILLALGIGWILASLGVFVRDINQITGLLSTILLFLSPIFFPLDALPEKYKPLFLLNPLSLIIQSSRAIIIWGTSPNWMALFLYTVAATLFALAGLYFFQRTRKGFADVL